MDVSFGVSEVIYNDGQQIKRQTISLAETKEHGRKQFTFPVDLSAATWARFEVWDIARNGAWTQTTWLKEPVKRALGIGSFTLINADTDYPVPGYEPISEGATIDLNQLPTRNLNIRIDPSPYVATKIDVEYDEDGTYHSDSSYPFSFTGEKEGRYDAWTPSLGKHKIKATPYKADDKGRPLTLNFSIIDSANSSNK